MEFGKKLLEKYGWKEGKGLGRDENGLQEALKPKPKHGTSGVGHNIADEFTNNWWQRIYDKAADNIQVKVKENGETKKLSSKDVDTFNIDTRKFVKSKQSLTNKKQSYLQSFVRRATLKGSKTEEIVKEEGSSDSESDETKIIPAPSVLTDDQLFAACGGRTAHKGARHGLKANGKLARIIQQEEDLYVNMKRKRDELKKDKIVSEKSKNHEYKRKKMDGEEIVELKKSSVAKMEAQNLKKK